MRCYEVKGDGKGKRQSCNTWICIFIGFIKTNNGGEGLGTYNRISNGRHATARGMGP